MIQAPTSCFYLFKVEGEAAKAVAEELSPASAADIGIVTFTSADFEVDIAAVNSLSKVIDHVKHIALLGDDVKIEEQYNPLYVPVPMEQVDEMLHLDSRGDSIRFIGMNGNPYTLKTCEATVNDQQVLAGRIEYRPFEIPGYTDIADQRKNLSLN